MNYNVIITSSSKVGHYTMLNGKQFQVSEEHGTTGMLVNYAPINTAHHERLVVNPMVRNSDLT